MAGKSGKLNMKLKIQPNEKASEAFRKGYTLQVTVVMDGEHSENIEADGATIANVGKDKQLTYIIFPNETKTLEIHADITDFEMQAIAINGVKMELGIDVDSLESEELKNKVKELQDGAKELDDGAKSVEEGSKTLQSGAESIQAGINAMQNGIKSAECEFCIISIWFCTSKSGITNHSGVFGRLQYRTESSRFADRFKSNSRWDSYVGKQFGRC